MNAFNALVRSRSGQRKTLDRLAATAWKAAANIGITDPILFLQKEKNPRRADQAPRVLRDGDPPLEFPEPRIAGRHGTWQPFRATRAGGLDPLRHISNDVGARAALLYQEIRRCLGLRKGGEQFNGERWIWKTMQELSDRFGFSVRDIQRHLKKLCDLGWLKREKKKASKNWDQTYWYAFGDVDPYAEAKSCPVRERQADATEDAGLSGSSSCSRKRRTGAGAPRRWEQSSEQPEQPYAIPDADATRKVIDRWEGMAFCPPPGTNATRPASQGFAQ